MSFSAKNPHLARFNGQTAIAAPKRISVRLCRHLARKTRSSTHWAFEGTTTPACGRKGWSRVPRTTRVAGEVTCRGCAVFLAKVAR
jgi:hypothetical protein